jgi:hypothetical protein
MAAGTPSLNDMYVLSQNSAYQNRVQAALLQACMAIATEGFAVPFHRERQQAIVNYLSSAPTLASAVTLFSNTCATDTASIGAATVAATNYVALTSANVAAQQALITDAQISNAISSQFNSFIREPMN